MADYGALARGESVHKKAAALRKKYVIGKYRIRPGLVGVHPSRPAGLAPSSGRCVSLLKSIIRDGYDAAEGDHAALCVQEALGPNHVQSFNDQALQGDPLLTPSIEGVVAQYGSLSHSHLNQVFKNILGKLPLGIDAVCASDGRACMLKLKEVDEKLAEACDNGLFWEILSYKIMEEEPRGCEIIQAALNSKNAVALAYHEMELLSSLSQWCTKSSAMAEKLTYESAREAMALTYPDMVAGAEFVGTFKLVIDLGAGKAPFLASLQGFAARFVNPQVRKLRMQAFSAVAALPDKVPRLKIAILKWAYMQEPKFGFCPVPDVSKFKNLAAACLEDAETNLHNVHVGLASVVEMFVDEYKKVQWLGNVDNKIAAVLMAAKGKETRVAIKDSMGQSLSVLLVKLAAMLGKEKAPTVKKKVDEVFPELVKWPAE